MKKFLALFLALITILSVSLVACGKKDGESTNTTAPNDDLWTGAPIEPGTDSGSDSTPVTTLPPADLTWKNDGNTIYIANIHECKIYTTADSNTVSNQAGSVKFGESYTRVRYNDLWSEITVNGVSRYVKTDYVTSDPGYVVYSQQDATVYVNCDTLFLRWCNYDEATADATVAAVVEKGTELKQTGVSQNGKWIRIEAQA